MENKEDWKKVEEDILNKDSEKIANYGVDIIGELDNLIKKNNNVKRKKIKKIIKISFRSFMILIIIFAVALLMFGFYLYDSMFKSRHDVDPTEFIEAISEEKVKCISKKVDNNKNGLYEYRPKSNKEIVIHAVKKFGKTDSDVIEQYFKYYFEKWSDEYKDKFVIKQGYKECEIYPEETSQWLLSYSVYAEIHNYQELIEYTDAIIRFLQFSDNSLAGMDMYLIYNNTKIYPYNKYPTSNEEIKQSAIIQYNNITKNDNANTEITE